MKLYTYWRSSSAYRVRIALNLKGLEYQAEPVHLVKGGGQQRSPGYKAINPQGLVPSLEDKNRVITQSLAIMEYLDEAYPNTHRLLPQHAHERAKVRSLALLIATDIQPLDNLRVLQYLKNDLQITDQKKSQWYAHWIIQGFDAYEAQLNNADRFSFGDSPGLADTCLIPQIYNAQRFNIDLSAYPNILKVNKNCLELEAFDKARPENQPDAVA